jgi:hypothetical protein
MPVYTSILIQPPIVLLKFYSIFRTILNLLIVCGMHLTEKSSSLVDPKERFGCISHMVAMYFTSQFT